MVRYVHIANLPPIHAEMLGLNLYQFRPDTSNAANHLKKQQKSRNTLPAENLIIGLQEGWQHLYTKQEAL